MYVNYGCGNNAPKEWLNYDASPSLIYEKINIFKTKFIFPKNVKFGDIVKGLPIKENSCDGIFCSHVLEHLSFNDFNKALKNTYKILKPNGIFRLIMPDLEFLLKEYLKNKGSNITNASVEFMKSSLLGMQSRPKGLAAHVRNVYGNSRHLWLWDKDSTYFYLQKTGFKNIKECFYGVYTDEMFNLVEKHERFYGSFGFEMIK